MPAGCRPNLPGVAGPRLVHDADFKMASPACRPFQGHGEDAPDRPATREASPAKGGPIIRRKRCRQAAELASRSRKFTVKVFLVGTHALICRRPRDFADERALASGYLCARRAPSGPRGSRQEGGH